MNSNKWDFIPAETFCIKVTDGTHDSPKRVESGKKLITSKHMNEFNLDFQNAYMISNEDFEQINQRSKVDQYDLIFSMIGTVGNVYLEKDNKIDYVVKNVGIFKNKNKLDALWLFYYLKSNLAKEYLYSYLNGSTQQYITLDSLRKYPILNPNLNTKKQIVKILSSLDDKIELNQKINKNLEELAQTLYKRWFVDFEFPNQEGLPYYSSGGEMVESELGLIPKGWEYKPIQSIVDTVLGGTPSRKISDYWGPGYEWLKSGELNNFRIIKGTETITQKGLDSSATKIMPKGTVLIGITGYVGLVSMLEIEACANQSVVGIIPNNLFPRTFLYGLIKSEIGDIASKQTGSAQQHINKSDINTHRVLIPTNQLITKFHSILEPIHQKLSNNIFENEKLSIIRDELLPKLMSGEIEVPAGEDNGA